MFVVRPQSVCSQFRCGNAKLNVVFRLPLLIFGLLRPRAQRPTETQIPEPDPASATSNISDPARRLAATSTATSSHLGGDLIDSARGRTHSACVSPSKVRWGIHDNQ